jgi:hypothetical protein
LNSSFLRAQTLDRDWIIRSVHNLWFGERASQLEYDAMGCNFIPAGLTRAMLARSVFSKQRIAWGKHNQHVRCEKLDRP